ncbi:MAG: dipeptide epimerase [Vampirovibrionales bacterium]|nr:dipeptide epimerase [Vampirovibrionales bacterium]
MLIRYHNLSLPLEFTFTISRGSSVEAKTVYVEIVAEYKKKTYVGLGEAVPAIFYGEDQQSVGRFYDQLTLDHALSDLDPFNHQAFEARLARYPGNMAAKSALDMALYDLRGKILKQPTWKLLGLDATSAPKTSYTIGIADLDTVIHKTRTALRRGYDILKVKVGSPDDLETLNAIRNLAPEATIRADANAAWTLAEALELLPELAALGVEFVEEPLKLDSSEDDYDTLFEKTPLPLMADESCKTLGDIPRCAEFFHAINLKHTKTGGLSEALRMIHAARAHELKIMLGCFCESSISISAFAQLSPLADYADLDGALLLAQDPYQGVTFKGSQIILNNKAGLGVSPLNINKTLATPG